MYSATNCWKRKGQRHTPVRGILGAIGLAIQGFPDSLGLALAREPARPSTAARAVFATRTPLTLTPSGRVELQFLARTCDPGFTQKRHFSRRGSGQAPAFLFAD